jgi:hypothetical protein
MACLTVNQRIIAMLLLLLLFLGYALAEERYITTHFDGKQVLVKDNRRPSLYTGDFGDCMGSSSINVTRFDAAYYRDNMTVLFHLAGDTALKNESIMSTYMLQITLEPDR